MFPRRSSSVLELVVRCLVLSIPRPSFSVLPRDASARPAYAEASPDGEREILRILHVVTSLDEYDTGRRHTQKSSDRLFSTVLPTVTESVSSLLASWDDEDAPRRYLVDVYLILGYGLPAGSPRRILAEEAIMSLPHFRESGGSLDIWDDAVPIGGRPEDLSRQHRLVVKDALEMREDSTGNFYYDLFSCWEDDMQVLRHHFDTYLGLLGDAGRLRTEPRPVADSFHAPLSEEQRSRLIPGFLRVEVLVSPSPRNPGLVPPRPDADVDPGPCCGAASSAALMAWETKIFGLSVRRLGEEWVAMLPSAKRPRVPVGSYWAGTGGWFGKAGMPEPGPHPHYFAQQAGWIATRAQVDQFDATCAGGFLPAEWRRGFSGGRNGLGAYLPYTVEHWSGGMHLFGEPCQYQRFISLDPEIFSRQLILHKSNNKQHQITKQRQVLIKDLLGQLWTIMDEAEQSLKNGTSENIILKYT